MMDGAERELFARSLDHATAHQTGADLDRALCAAGWLEALGADRHTAVSALFESQGRTNATSSALAWLLAATLRTERAVVLPELGRWTPPGTLDGGSLRVQGVVVGTDAVDDLLVTVMVDDKPVAFTASLGALDHRPLGGMDPAGGLTAVRGVVTPVEVGPADWAAAVAAGQLAVGHQLVGAARQMLELACDHARERIQFDRPIAAFQAVRHRLAETLVAIEAAEALLDAAWEEQSDWSATMAKAVAGRSARTTARHCQQVLAGIGFTAEHPFHRYFRRVRVLDQLFGSSQSLTRALGEDLLTERRLPPQFAL